MAETLYPRPRTKGLFFDFDFMSLQMFLLMAEPFILIFMLYGGLAFVPVPSMSFARGLILIVYVAVAGIAVAVGFFFQYNKANVARNRHVVKARIRFLHPNSTEEKGSIERTLLIEKWEILKEEEIIRDVLTRVFGRSFSFKQLSRDQDKKEGQDQKTKDKKPEEKSEYDLVQEAINQLLPKTVDNRPYVLVRYYCPMSPFPEMIQEKDNPKIYVEGGRGTKIYSSFIMFTHPDFITPGELWSKSQNIETLYAYCRTEETAYLGDLDAHLFFKPSNEFIMTPGLTKIHRKTMTYAIPTKGVQEFAHFEELMAETHRSKAAEESEKHLSTALDTMADLKIGEGAYTQAIETLSKQQRSAASMWFEKNRGYVIIIVIIFVCLLVLGLIEMGIFKL